MKPGTASGGRKPSKAPIPPAPQEPLFWQKRTGAATVLALLPDQHGNRQSGVWYAITALSVFVLVISALISAASLFCIPFLGFQCKSGTVIDARASCANGRVSPESCARDVAARSPGQASMPGRAGAAAQLPLTALPKLEDREAIEAMAAKRAMAEQAAREHARFEAEEHRKADEATRLSTQREAEDRRKAEQAAQLSAQREAEERQAAEATAQVPERAPQPTQIMASLTPVQENAAPSLPDGDYSGRTARDESCSPSAESVIVTIKGGRVCWEHDLKSANRWAGTIDPAGVIQARAESRPGTVATGQVVNGGAMSVEMTYPDCANPVRLKLLGMIGKASTCP